MPVTVAIIALLAIATLLNSGMQDTDTPRSSRFELPAKRMERMRLEQMLVVCVSQKKLELAMQTAERLTQLESDAPNAWYNLACVQAISGNTQAALVSLQSAVKHGFRNERQLKTDPALKLLREQPEFDDILLTARQPFAAKDAQADFQAAQIENGIALVADRNTRWDESRMSLVTSFVPDTVTVEKQIAGKSEAEVVVDGWINAGKAAGHFGDLYDNRDRDHSNLNRAKFPGLAFVEYSPEVSRVGADWGMRSGQAFDRPTFGNSSTALVNSPFWRSNPRMVLYDDLLMKLVYNEFVSNQMYCYPEHNDFDPQHGDVYPANTPFWVISNLKQCRRWCV